MVKQSVIVATVVALLMFPSMVTAADPTQYLCVVVPEGASLKKAVKDGAFRVSDLSECALAIGAVLPTPEPTPQPTPEPTPDAAVLRLSGPASPDYQPLSQAVVLDAGDYTLQWSVSEPFPEPGVCGVTIDLFGSDGDWAGGQSGVMTMVGGAQSGAVDYGDLDAGAYDVFVYVGCPWAIELIRN